MRHITFRFTAFLGLLPSLVGVAVAQSAVQLTARYGPPEVERYQVTPEASLTVAYGRDRTVCQLSVEPRKTSVLGSARTRETPTLSTELVSSLLNEFLPLGARQGEPKAMAEQMSCAALLSEDYDNVKISRTTNERAPAGKKVTSMVIQWKRPECSQQIVPDLP